MHPVQQNYRADIDGLRAVSILLVLLFHGFADVVPGGYIGVDVFFVISGYLITSQIYGRTRAGNFSFLEFYARRIRRIFPPLIVVLAFAGLYGYWRLNLTDFTALFKHIAAGTAFISNFVLQHEAGYFDKHSAQKPLLHLWSLAIEEQFYVLWPVVVAVLTVLTRRHRAALGGCLLLMCLVSFGTAIYLATRDSIAAFYSPLARFWELGLGGLLAVVPAAHAAAKDQRFRQAWDIAAATACIGLVACALLMSGERRAPVPLNALPVLLAMVVVAAGPDAAINRRLLASKPMMQLGLISYALYLWHWPLLSFLRIERAGHQSAAETALALATSVGLAVLTHAVIEKPIRQHAGRRTPLWLAALFVGIGVTSVLIYGTESLQPARLLQQAQLRTQILAASTEFSLDGIPSKNCHALAAADSPAQQLCLIWGAENAPHTVAMWGDSMSLAWLPPFLTWARVGDWRVVQIARGGCPPIVGVRRTDPDGAICGSPELQARQLEILQRAKPDVVFLIARWNLYYHGHIVNDVLVDKSFISDGPQTADAGIASKAFARQLPETIRLLSAFSRVVVFKDTPVLKVPIDIGLTTRADTFEPTATAFKQFEAPINQVIDDAVMHTPGAMAFDPAQALCHGGRCSAYLDGHPAYSDEVHLTAHAALQFAPAIRSLGTLQ